MAGQKRGKGFQALSIRDVIFSKAKALPNGKYEAEISASIFWGDHPARSVLYQFLVANQPVSNKKLVGYEGKVRESLRVIHGDEVFIELAPQSNPGQKSLIPLGTVPGIPEAKRKLEFFGSFPGPSDDKQVVFLRRLGKDGKPEAGEICFWDFIFSGEICFWDFILPEEKNPERQVFTWNSTGQVLRAEFDRFEKSRTIEFFLPDDKEVKLKVEIPAKVIEVEGQIGQIEEAQKQEEKKRRQEEFAKGRAAFQKLATEIKATAKKPAAKEPQKPSVCLRIFRKLRRRKEVTTSILGEQTCSPEIDLLKETSQKGGN
jgi:exoribonuclease R